MTRDMNRKIRQNGAGRQCSNFGLKIQCTRPVYVKANMACSYRLTCLKGEGNNLLKL